jgi:hypothetical protein
MKYIKQLLGFFKPQSKRDWVESYLAQSVDIYDLEARQRELARKGIY